MRPILTLEDAIYDLIHHSTVPAKAQAEALGISYSRLVNCPIEAAESAFHHTRWLVPQTQLTGNTVAVDYIERMLGRVAVPVTPKLNGDHSASIHTVSLQTLAVAKEMGEAAAEIRKSLKDQTLTASEATRCRKEVWDLIQAAATVYQHLESFE